MAMACPMETKRRERNDSGSSFSFPSTPNQDSDFEFGCLTPDSPSSGSYITSPADHLFFNGRLLPHSFPFQQQPPATTNMYDNNSRTTSRTSSISSKDSLMSSRSNSTNSSRSSCSISSARTSSSDCSERNRLMYLQNKNKVTCKSHDQPNKTVNSQRWQYITAVPVLNREYSSRRRKNIEVVGKKEVVKGKKMKTTRVKLSFVRRLLRWFLTACKECHAMEPSRKERVLRQNEK
ncbi:Membrane-associated kinase regulator [Quillaja saponaria]|uniref:Membrane-associated kinase regulator n=1 Tax=Quillaja saponaria TaxID=32244 RepID=A0AAD7KZ95_QUISA|nr:Membrane-associated kinase regulator [Quillaja saponaria]